MLSAVSNVAVSSNADEKSSDHGHNMFKVLLDVVEQQYQGYLSNDVVADCGGAKGAVVSDFNVKLADGSKTVLPSVKNRTGKASKAGEHSGFATAASSESHGSQYECNICRKTFAKELSLIRHKERVCSCNECDRMFCLRSALQQHIESVHREKIRFQCQLCPDNFANAYDLGMHNRLTHKSDGYYACDECDKKFKLIPLLKKHKKNRHSIDSPFRCSHCGMLFNRKRTLANHMLHSHFHQIPSGGTDSTKANHHMEKQNADSGSVVIQSVDMADQPSTSGVCVDKSGAGHECVAPPDTENAGSGPVSCLKGKVRFRKPAKAKQRAAKASAVYQCLYCEESFRFESRLGRHAVRKHPEKVSGRIVCKYCDKRFWSPSECKEHITRLHPEYAEKDYSEYKCGFCNLVFSYRSFLQKHMNVMHPDTTDVQLECSYCAMLFCSEDKLECHITDEHTPEPSFEFLCDMCGESFSLFSTYNRHRITRHDKGEFICRYCEMSFVTNQERTKHMFSAHAEHYVGRRKYDCAYCEDVYVNRVLLKHHQLSQHGDKITFGQKCDFCEQRYIDIHALRKHQASVHLNEIKNESRCQYCQVGFVCTERLNEHIEDQHLSLARMDGSECNNRDTVFPDEVTRHASEKSSHHDKNPSDEKVEKRSGNDRTRIPRTVSRMTQPRSEEHQVDDVSVLSQRRMAHSGKAQGQPESQDCTKSPVDRGHTSNAHQRTDHQGTHRPVGNRRGRVKMKLSCVPCNLKFSNYYQLRKHLLWNHPETVSSDCRCQLCGIAYLSKSRLVLHQTSCHPEKYRGLFSCAHCDYTSANNSIMKRHIAVAHNNKDKYKCEYCDKKFSGRISLGKHQAFCRWKNNSIQVKKIAA